MASGSVRAAALLVCAATALAFWNVGGHEFLDYDDPLHVTGNEVVQGGLTPGSVVWAFTARVGGNWHPLTWLSYMTDVALFGLDPAWHHAMNVALHAAAAVVLLAALARMTGAVWPSALVALLFALHPLHVESVAWISERKDTLSGLFFMLGLYAYARYAERRSRARFAAVTLAFVCALASKATVVTFPLVLLLLDVWPLGRTGRERFASLVVEKLPLFALSLAFGALTMLTQHQAGAVSSMGALPLSVRISQALISAVAYVAKALWPRHLAFFYPYPDVIPLWQVAGAALLLVASTVLALRVGKTRPVWAVGWLWYLVTLAPVSGVVQVGLQAMADRYTYLPLVGLFLAGVFGVREVLAAWPRAARLQAPLAAALVAACIAQTRIQVGTWRNDVALNEHALAVTRDNYLAHNNLAMELVHQQRFADAQTHLLEALRIKPSYLDARSNLAGVLVNQGRLYEATEQLRAIVVDAPRYAPAHRNLAALLAQGGKADEAAAHLREAERLEAAGAL
ncbi:MAG TPA: tetratricopeptide repeat protein [Myxococcota bacterium]|nr:tetratricopeptide repeat protein [Myxococcota bacterium]